MRYQLLPHLYSLFHSASEHGSMVARALWMNFPTDPTTLTQTDGQFMLGNEVLISPVVTEGATSINAYFPWGLWYDFAERSLAVDASANAEGKEGLWQELDTPLTKVNVHVRGGSVLPLQEAAMTTTAARETPFTLLVALCPGGKAWGSLFWDDGEQIEIKEYINVEFAADTSSSASPSAGVFTATATAVASSVHAPKDIPDVDDVVVLGKGLQQPKAATLNGSVLSASQITFDAAAGRITFSGLALKLNENIDLKWL